MSGAGGLPDVKLRALVNFPVAVTGGVATNVRKVNGHYYIDHDVSGLVQNTNISAGEVAQSWMTIWNSALNAYQNVPYALAVPGLGVQSLGGNTGALDIGNGLEFAGSTLQFAQPITFVFATLADAIAFNIPSTAGFFVTAGRSSALDGGGAKYLKLGSAPSPVKPWHVHTADGAYWVLSPHQIIVDKMLGVKADDTTDDTQALTNCGDFLRTFGCQRFIMDGGARKVWPSAPVHGTVLIDVSGTQGLTIDYVNGASIHAITPNSTTDATGRWGIIYDISGSENLTILNPAIDQDGAKLPSFTAGVIHFIYGGPGVTKRFKALNVRQVGGVAGLQIGNPAAIDRESISRDFELTGQFTFVQYPANFQGNGDDFRGNYKTTDCGRSYFAYNVSGHRVYLESNCSSLLDNVVIKNYASASFRRYTSDIEVWYCLRRTGLETFDGNVVSMDFQQTDATSRSGEIQDVHIHFDVRMSGITFTAGLFSMNKYTSAGAGDNTGRAYGVKNVTVSGLVEGVFSASPINLFANNNWTGDSIQNVVFEDFLASFNPTAGGVFFVGGTGMNGSLPGLTLRNTVMDIALAPTNMAGQLSVESSYLAGDYSDRDVTSGGITWRVSYLPKGKLRLTTNVIAVAAGGITVTLPFTDANGGQPNVVLTPQSSCKFWSTTVSTNSFGINHDSGGSVNFRADVEMRY